MRAAEAARTLAQWDGGAPPPADVGTPPWLKAQPSRDKTTDIGHPGQASTGPVVEASYSRPFLTYGSIGTACALAEFKDGALKVWSHCQGPAVLRDWLARALGLTASQVTVFHRQGAGAYGHNTADDAAFDASFIAMRHPGRTVRVQWSREDEFAGAPMSTAMAIKLRAVLDADNKPADWSIEIWSPPHAQRPGMNGNSNLLGAEALPNSPPQKELNDVPDERGGGATRNAVAIYDLPRHRLIHHLLPKVPMRTSSLRGLGAWANVFAIESFIDELADVAGEDPVSYRLSLLSDPRPRRVVETAARMSGWFEQRDLPKAAPAASASPATRTSPRSPPWLSRWRWPKKSASSASGAQPTPASSSRRTAPATSSKAASSRVRASCCANRCASRAAGRRCAPGTTIRSCASATCRRSTSS